MNTNYRKFEPDDLESLQGLMLELGYSLKRSELSNNVKEILQKSGEVFIAEDNSEIVGSICVLIDVRLAEGVYAEIVSLVVSEDARG